MVRAISTIPPTSSSGQQSLLIQIERAPALPFRKPKIVTASPGDVTLSSHLFDNNRQQRVEAVLAEIHHREERLRAFEKTNLLTLPFRQAGYWMWRGFLGVRRAFTGQGFGLLHVKGKNLNWKLDKDPAWALDDGKVLDRLVKIKLR